MSDDTSQETDLDRLVQYVREFCDERLVAGKPGPDLCIITSEQFDKVRAEAKARGGFTNNCYCGCGGESIYGVPVIVVEGLSVDAMIVPRSVL